MRVAPGNGVFKFLAGFLRQNLRLALRLGCDFSGFLFRIAPLSLIVGQKRLGFLP